MFKSSLSRGHIKRLVAAVVVAATSCRRYQSGQIERINAATNSSDFELTRVQRMKNSAVEAEL